ncbi:MAG: LysR family transcriptional regulator, partial [Gammaproteobacteria bacterium]|nr:LysR family transcriptional regulator [Gammaproteobacteria bacterium]
MKFTLRQLEVFVAVSRTQSVTHASEKLVMKALVASTALSELEKQFDTLLFDRVGKSLRINELGQELLPHAVEFLDRAEEIKNILEGHAGYGLLRIGATLTVGNYLATILVAKYLHEHPESRVKLDVHNTQSIIRQIANHELDLGLVEGECNHQDIMVNKWVGDELIIFCSPNHLLANKKRITIKDLLKERWILRESGSGTRETFDRAFYNYHSELDIRLELEHTEAIKLAVESGLGIGCISRLALKENLKQGTLIALKTPDLDLFRYFYFLWHKQKYQSAGMRAFLSLC